jgi:hypothetical protein
MRSPRELKNHEVTRERRPYAKCGSLLAADGCLVRRGKLHLGRSALQLFGRGVSRLCEQLGQFLEGHDIVSREVWSSHSAKRG